MDLFTTEYLQALLGPAEQAKLTKILFITAIVWWTMRGKVAKVKEEITQMVTIAINAFKKHNEEMEKTLAEGVQHIKNLGESVTRDIEAQKGWAKKIENRVQALEGEK